MIRLWFLETVHHNFLIKRAQWIKNANYAITTSRHGCNDSYSAQQSIHSFGRAHLIKTQTKCRLKHTHYHYSRLSNTLAISIKSAHSHYCAKYLPVDNSHSQYCRLILINEWRLHLCNGAMINGTFLKGDSFFILHSISKCNNDQTLMLFGALMYYAGQYIAKRPFKGEDCCRCISLW